VDAELESNATENETYHLQHDIQTVDVEFLEHCSILYRYDLDLHYTGLYGVYAYNAYTENLMYIGAPYVWLNSCSIDGFALQYLSVVGDLLRQCTGE